MSELQDDPLPQSLPEELQLALRSATWRALNALQSLRLAVRDHVDHECARGLSQGAIDDGLRSMIDSCGPAVDNVDYSAARTNEITKQVMKWSATYYKPRR